jgi:hypothetical protein
MQIEAQSSTGIVTDETGLHAEGCNCPTCELGLRPTELERAAARRALVKRRAAEEQRKREEVAKSAKAGGAVEVKCSRIMAEPPRPVVMPTPEEREELARLRREMFRR